MTLGAQLVYSLLFGLFPLRAIVKGKGYERYHLGGA